jgi:SAM-dependent methyltransferase
MPMAADLSQTRLDLQQRRGQPPMLLLGVTPAIDLVRPLANERIEVLNPVRRRERDAQLPDQPQPMQRPCYGTVDRSAGASANRTRIVIWHWMGEHEAKIVGRRRNVRLKQGSRTKASGSTKYRLPPLIVLEVGAGGALVGPNAGTFVKCLGTNAGHRRALLQYANRRPVRGQGPPFRVIGFMASDMDRNPANDACMNALALPIDNDTVHVVVSVGPRGYGFRNDQTAEMFLSEIGRVLRDGGELLVMGSYVNPWFNLDMGSRKGRRRMGQLARHAGLRLVNYLRPFGRHAVGAIIRGNGQKIIQHRTTGQAPRPPSSLHRFVKEGKS